MIINIPFNKPFLTGNEHKYLHEAQRNGQLSGDGIFTKFCSEWIENYTGCNKALITHSCTAALEMAGILLGIKPGDEVIMPSYTFVSTANAFVLRGGVPVFVDVNPKTQNIDETLIEQAITSKTRAIVAVHYAGVACEMDVIMKIANDFNLIVIEDAAQGIMSSYKGRALGSIGHLGCYSFHETKNIISGEGGAILINDTSLIERAEIIREKGTNRSSFSRGQVDKYTWIDVGSSYLPGEIISAFLWAQMQEAEKITARRMEIWSRYHESFEKLERIGRVQRPFIPKGSQHNAHMYYLILSDKADRTNFIEFMRGKGILCVFHYIPLHSSPQGLVSGRVGSELLSTSMSAECLVRLPLWLELGEGQQTVIDNAFQYLTGL